MIDDNHPIERVHQYAQKLYAICHNLHQQIPSINFGEYLTLLHEMERVKLIVNEYSYHLEEVSPSYIHHIELPKVANSIRALVEVFTIEQAPKVHQLYAQLQGEYQELCVALVLLDDRPLGFDSL